MKQGLQQWVETVDQQDLLLIAVLLFLVVVFRGPLARLLISVNLAILRSMSLNPPDSAKTELEPAIRVSIVGGAFFIAVQILDFPHVVGGVIEKLVLTIIVVSLFAAWYKLSPTLIAVLNPKQLENIVTEMDWAVRVARFVIILMGIAALLALWNVDIGAAMTGVGVFGAGLAIAAQDMLRNLFAGMSNVSEKRFETGDWITVDGVVQGMVKQIDLRSTTVIGFDRVPCYVPNADLANATVQNISRVDHRQIDWIVSLVMTSTQEQVDQVCSELRAYLKDSGLFVTNGDALCLVQAVGLSDALEIKIYAFTLTGDYADYMGVCELLTAKIREIATKAGTSLAYPTHAVVVETVDPAFKNITPKDS